MADSLNLFEGFDTISKEEWLEKIKKDLKGDSLADLQWHLNENMTISPFAHSDDIQYTLSSIVGEKTSNEWEIGANFHVKNAKESNKELLAALINGVNAPCLMMDQPLSKSELEQVFDKIEVHYISIHFSGEAVTQHPMHTIQPFIELMGERSKVLKGSVYYDPLKEEGSQFPIAYLNKLKQHLPHFKSFSIDTHSFNQGTKSVVEELALTIHQGRRYLNALLENGYTAEAANRQIQFNVFTGTSYFVELAKIRALKLLWLNILAAYGNENMEGAHINAHQMVHEKEVDENTDRIRATTQAMSMILGGIDRMTIQSDDSAFGKRIAINMHHILKMESFLDQVIDPAAGSYYIEQLTHSFGEKAWTRFQEMN